MNTRFFHTLRYLRFEQIAFRVYYHFRRSSPPSTVGKVQCRRWRQPWASPAWQTPSLSDAGEFRFLNEAGTIESPADWNHSAKSKLWLYNLHYFDDLTAKNAGARVDSHVSIVDRWIGDNPPLGGNGWEPYVISLRLVNWVKWCSGQGRKAVRPQWVKSLALQARVLAAKIEYHIQGNHLLANGKALVFAGAFLQGPRSEKWFRLGLKILDREIPEQFLSDGAHFELSPMYHAALLWDICDLINLAGRSGLKELLDRRVYWRKIVNRGLTWLASMAHPDGDIAFFNDAAFDIAPRLADIENYAAGLGCSSNSVDKGSGEPAGSRALIVEHLEASGYCAVCPDVGHKAILDMAPVGPNYQPGHAHADTLSFELSLYGRRLLVNSGTSQYGNDVERQRQRGTRAHNTVVIDGENSSETWAGFRVGRRAEPQNIAIQQSAEQWVIRCSHNGYRRLQGKNIHYREWIFSKNQLIVRDRLTGNFSDAEARYHFHPDVLVSRIGKNTFQAILKKEKSIFIRIVGAREVFLIDTTWHPRFGVSISNRCIAVKFDCHEILTHIDW